MIDSIKTAIKNALNCYSVTIVTYDMDDYILIDAIMVRYERMGGSFTEWAPGWDESTITPILNGIDGLDWDLDLDCDKLLGFRIWDNDND